MSAPPFDLSAPRYDQGTYGGRLAHFIEMTDMRMLLTTDAQLQQACDRLDEFEKTGRLPAGVSDEVGDHGPNPTPLEARART